MTSVILLHKARQRALLPGLAAGLCQLAGAAEFPSPHDTQSGTNLPLPAAEAAARWQVPAGFAVTAFAGEPDVRQPIAMAFDARGRLWVAENYTYAEPRTFFDLKLRDRVLILEDKDNDGHFDGRKVFFDQAQKLTSVEPGFGGAFLLCPPQLLFVADRNGDDVPDGEPEVLLDGFTTTHNSHHTLANGLRWGPDGWLYGRVGITSHAHIGRPGTPDAERVELRGGIWRYHPTRRVVEAVCHGTTNPWGMDWDEYGELFFINTVIGHLWHAIPGAHFKRMHGEDVMPRAYAFIDQHADHFHFDTGQGWTKSRAAADGEVAEGSDALGGGHAHCGLLIYQGDNWPAAWRGKLLTLNMHGRRVNVERLERSGSGYVGRHEPDAFVSADTWLRGIDLIAGPDGTVFVADWSDTGECHDSDGVHRSSGRIFRISHGEPKKVPAADLANLSDSDLVNLQLNTNEWLVRQARLLLQQRAASGRDMASTHETLRKMYRGQPNIRARLRALWALFVTGGTSEAWLREQLNHENEHIRAWAVRLLTDAGVPGAQTLSDFQRLAREDKSGLVRLYLASTLQRLPLSQRAALAAPLLARSEDANDHNLPLLLWYGLEPLAGAEPLQALALAEQCRIPLTRKLIARRLAENLEKNPELVNALLRAVAVSSDPAFQQDLLDGLGEALRGWRKARKPEAWEAVQVKFSDAPETALRARVRELSVVFGDGRALDEVKATALDGRAEPDSRRAAVAALIASRPSDLRTTLESLLSDRATAAVAVRGLSGFDDPAIAALLVSKYRSLSPDERVAAVDTLASRPAFAGVLLNAIAETKIPREDVSAFHARQIRGFNDAELAKRLSEVWGEVRASDATKRDAIARYKRLLTQEQLRKANVSAGRALFNQACAACHKLYGEGGELGPDLTGSGRRNLDYLLENLIDPSAVVPSDYRMSVITLKDGRVLNAVIGAKTDRTLTARMQTATETIERAEVEAVTESALSIMPEGLIEAFSEQQTRDLIAYLMGDTQAPLK